MDQIGGVQHLDSRLEHTFIGKMGRGRGQPKKLAVMTPLTVVRVFTPLSNTQLKGVNKILNEDETNKGTKGKRRKH